MLSLQVQLDAETRLALQGLPAGQNAVRGIGALPRANLRELRRRLVRRLRRHADSFPAFKVGSCKLDFREPISVAVGPLCLAK